MSIEDNEDPSEALPSLESLLNDRYEEPQAVTGRPRKPFDWKQLAKLCMMQCTRDEIADIIGVSHDTLAIRIRERFDCTFSTFYKKYSSMGKESLRRLQWRSAEKGNVTMQIWLGKQMLGQTEKTELTARQEPFIIKRANGEEIELGMRDKDEALLTSAKEEEDVG